MNLREILQIGSSPLSRELQHATDVIDRLHRCPDLPAIPIVLTRTLREGGAYFSRARPHQAVKISISLHTTHPALTLVHEIGHFLDHLVLNPLKEGFGSEHDPDFEEMRATWQRSRLVRQLEGLLTHASSLAPATRRVLRYQLLPAELWARTYVQWAVTRSNDLLLASQLRAERQRPMIIRRFSTDFFWDGADVDCIMNVVDDLFHKRGLL
jgi:hypothetical protein